MRRGEIYEVLRRLVALKPRYRGYRVIVVDRSMASGVKGIPVENIARIKWDAMILDDGSIIPLHRVIGVADPEGRMVWSRSGRVGGGEEA